MSLPDGVLKSKLSRRLTNAIPQALRSARELTRCLRLRPKRSIFQTNTASNLHRRASEINRFESWTGLLRPGNALVNVFLVNGQSAATGRILAALTVASLDLAGHEESIRVHKARRAELA